MTALRTALRRDLPAAMKSGDAAAVSALRSALAAIENAEAVDALAVDASAVAPSTDRDRNVAGASAGVGTTEVDRRELSEDEVRQVVTSEIDERRSAAHDFERSGHPERAARLRAEAAVIQRYLV